MECVGECDQSHCCDESFIQWSRCSKLPTTATTTLPSTACAKSTKVIKPHWSITPNCSIWLKLNLTQAETERYKLCGMVQTSIVVLARDVAPPPQQGPREEAEVQELFENFKQRFNQSRGRQWHNKMNVYAKDNFGGMQGLLEYIKTGILRLLHYQVLHVRNLQKLLLNLTVRLDLTVLAVSKALEFERC